MMVPMKSFKNLKNGIWKLSLVRDNNTNQMIVYRTVAKIMYMSNPISGKFGFFFETLVTLTRRTEILTF